MPGHGVCSWTVRSPDGGRATGTGFLPLEVLLGMSLTTTYTSLGMETMVSALPALERQAVTIDRKSDEKVITKLENYQKSGSGALWELK